MRHDFHDEQAIRGQEEAIQQIINIYQTNLASMLTPGRPIGNFLLLGPTSSGKNPAHGGDRGELGRRRPCPD
jgi:ATP-dependent Clp protease ATP-binding subunit ClpA